MNRRKFLHNVARTSMGLAGWTLVRGGLPAQAEAPAPAGAPPSATLAGASPAAPSPAVGKPPNIIIILADDLGYGDLGCFGHPTIRTPNLDRMAAEGTKLTQFYSAASVCTPSRAALLTGRLPVRTGMCHDKRRVLFSNSAGGLPADETTIAEGLKTRGYATCCIGKWHLGHLPQYLPPRRGFDYYFGLPYSNDMRPSPLIEGEKVIEEPARQDTLTRRYTEKALTFIRRNKDRPFFLYFPHTFPHVPLASTAPFAGTSLRGLYGDVVQELDGSVAQILAELRKLDLASNTLVVFTSDNGPWLVEGLRGGSAGLLRGGKGSTWEGGMREPTIAWWPGRIPPATVNPALLSTLDVFPTCLRLAGVELPKERILDGYDVMDVLAGTGPNPRSVMFYYRGTRLYAVRRGPWKAHFITEAGYNDTPHPQDPPLLFHLEHDPSEQYDVAKNHAAVLADIRQEVDRHQANLRPAPSQLEAVIKAKGVSMSDQDDPAIEMCRRGLEG